MDKKTILFTGYYFDSFTGSMMHICEMGVYFASVGYKVSIATVKLTTENIK